MRSRFVPVVAAVALLAGNLQAQTQLTDRSQVADPVTQVWTGFSGSPWGVISSATTDGVFGVLNVPNQWGGGFLAGEDLLFTDAGTYTDFLFSNTLYAFGAEFWHNYPITADIIMQIWRGGLLIDFFNVATGGGAAANDGAGPFIGYADPLGFDHVRYTSLGSPGEFAMNQLTFSRVDQVGTVPEPASMTLLATGLAGLAASRRRRKAAA